MRRKSNSRNTRKTVIDAGLEGLDEEQLELGYSDKFWQLIKQRRKQRTMSRAELEKGFGNITV